MEKEIKVYNTHITISPYTKGENERLEKRLSLWIEAEFRYEPMAYYIYNNTLYIPKGYSVIELERMYNVAAFYMREFDKPKKITKVRMTANPKSRIQEEAINFLSCNDEFTKYQSSPQQALILDTGDGKTYCTIHSIVNYKLRALIITHQDKIKMQWIKSFQDFTTIEDDMLVNINGSDVINNIMDNKVEGFIYLVNHQTLTSYLKTHGINEFMKFIKKINIGIKVFDEAHLSFKNTLLIDMFSNTYKTFYLTANFGRSDSNEERLFKKCFSTVIKFGEQTKNYEEKRKHIIYIPVLYRSNPTYIDLKSVNNMYGFSVLNFSKYAIHNDKEGTQINILFKIFEICVNIEGRILITVPKIEDTEYLKDIFSDKYGHLGKSICTINSKHSKEENNYNKENYDIIISTIRSSGTGADIKKLRCIINLEPFSSNITANQLSGRLREYAKDKDTYFFDLIDISFPVCERQYKSKLKILKKKCKEIKVYNI